jgi:putative acetyltransferase
MVSGPDVSEMRPDDQDEVDALLRAAFPGSEEALLVHRLRTGGAMVSERVIRWQGRIGAYAGISRMVAPAGWFALAPVAVLPEWQGVRFGTRIVQHIASLYIDFGHGMRPELQPKDGKPTLVVLGKPSFYSRCGFSQERAARLATPYPVSYTLIARSGEDTPEERLDYPPAFEGV